MIGKVIRVGLQGVGALTLVGFVLVGVCSAFRAQAPVLAHRSIDTRGFAAMDEEAMPPPPPMAAPAPERKPSVRSAPKMDAKKAGVLAALGSGAGGTGMGHALGGAIDGLAKDIAPAEPAQEGESAQGEGGRLAAPTREWFPESFIFEPRVVTDAQGQASVPARVPDRLTSWRVLALAHSRAGLQAGAVTSFLGTLPAYVEPVVPPFLVAGDEIRLPVQVVNTTPSPLSDALSLEATGAQLANAGGRVQVPASGNKVEYASLKVPRPGAVTLKAAFGGTDAVVRTFPVLPNGKPVDSSFGGTLAAPRTLHVAVPGNALPESGRVRLAVFPGALALLRAELTGASSRGGADADAYALLLSGAGPGLLAQLGEKADAETVRAMTLVSAQRAFQHARTPDLSTAVLFAEAALAHPDNPVLARLGERLVDQAARAQRPDGTFSGADGWTVQRLLVATADGLRAVQAGAVDAKSKQRAQAAQVRAEGAFERNLKVVQDPFTAAVIPASGGATGSVADTLRERVREAVKKDEDGSRYLPVESGTVRADGAEPSVAQATALAALALQGDEKAPWRLDLGAYVLSRYRPDYGWGDGQTNLACLRAVLALFKDPLPSSIEVSLELDGKPVTSGTLSGAKLKDVVAMDGPVPDAAGPHTWTVKAMPAVPGLGYALSLRVYVPWEKSENESGFELTLDAPRRLKVGEPSEVEMKAVAPSGVAAKIRHALPAGVQADKASLEKLKADGVISGFEVEDGAVSLQLPPHQEGEVFSARYRVIPTFAGVLHASASTIAPQDRPELAYSLPPTVWAVQ